MKVSVVCVLQGLSVEEPRMVIDSIWTDKTAADKRAEKLIEDIDPEENATVEVKTKTVKGNIPFYYDEVAKAWKVK